MRIARRDAIAAAVGLLLVAAAFVLPRLHLGISTQLHFVPDRFGWHAGAAPIFGWFEAHVGWGSAPAILLGLASVVWGPVVAQRLSWRMLPLMTWAVSCGWAFSLAMIDGWQRGFAGRLTDKDEYLPQIFVLVGQPTREAALPAVDHRQRERPRTGRGPGDQR